MTLIAYHARVAPTSFTNWARGPFPARLGFLPTSSMTRRQLRSETASSPLSSRSVRRRSFVSL